MGESAARRRFIAPGAYAEELLPLTRREDCSPLLRGVRRMKPAEPLEESGEADSLLSTRGLDHMISDER